MKKLIIPLIALMMGLGACKSNTGSSAADSAGAKTDSLTDTSKKIKITTPAGAANTPGATGIGDTSTRSSQ